MDWLFPALLITGFFWVVFQPVISDWLEHNRLSYDFAKATGQDPQNKRWMPLEESKRTKVTVCVEEVQPDPVNSFYSYNWKWTLKFDLFNSDKNPHVFAGHALTKRYAYRDARSEMKEFMQRYVAEQRVLAKPECETYWV